MKPTRRTWMIPVGSRTDGTPWQIHVIELTGESKGPATAVVAGLYGDKPLGCLAVHEVDRMLSESDLKGTVLLVPAANLPALEAGTRVSPDHLYLNRRFPGSPKGFLTDQVAHALSATLLDRVERIVDLHSGTPTMALWYTYDAGDLELSASFGYLPVVTGFDPGGQLSALAARQLQGGLLPEFGGGPITSPEVGVEGTLNVLRYLGHIGGRPTGPRTLPVLGERSLMLASSSGILLGDIGPGSVGSSVGPGRVGRIVDVSSGATLEEFSIDREGLLMMAVASPAIIKPGDFAFMIGFPHDEVAVPGM